ncbi:hypothetical protein LTR85_002040 [Meristemomyces frigidus]|nr:hypothetical protein LTR85_002040 [Meristemomyces frigidus]
MDEFQGLFLHLTEYRVILFQKCAFAIVPVQILRHLKDHHPRTTDETQQSIIEICRNLNNVAQSADDVQYPNSGEAPIAGFPVYSNGMRCTAKESGVQCTYTCRGKTPRTIQRHCKEQHGWKNRQKRGGNARQKLVHSTNKMWQEGQDCQRFFEFGKWKKYFAVKVQPPQQERSVLDAEEREKRADAVIDKHLADIEAYRREQCIGGEGSRYTPMPWLDFTGWHRHLGDLKLDVLRYLRPAADEKSTEEEVLENVSGEDAEADAEDGGLADACRATRALIRTALLKCQDAGSEDGVGKAALEHINRREVGSKDREKPFYAKHTAQSIEKYSGRWTKMLRYIWRTADRENRPKYRLNDRQRRSLAELKKLARRERERGAGARRVSTGREKEWREGMQVAALTFWIAMFDHELRDSEYESGIISGLAVLALHTQGGGWMSPMYTPVCAAMMTVL